MLIRIEKSQNQCGSAGFDTLTVRLYEMKRWPWCAGVLYRIPRDLVHFNINYEEILLTVYSLLATTCQGQLAIFPSQPRLSKAWLKLVLSDVFHEENSPFMSPLRNFKLFAMCFRIHIRSKVVAVKFWSTESVRRIKNLRKIMSVNVSVNNFFAYVSHVRLLLYSIVPYLSCSWRCGFLFRWRGASGLQHVQLHPAEFKGKTALHGVSPLIFLYIVVHVILF